MFEMHYVPKPIAQVKDSDTRVALVGKVVEVKEGSFVLEDETGRKEIVSDKHVEVGKVVRVFCSQSEGKLSADIVQDMSKLDVNLFKRVRKLYERVGV
jgi:hypothetical protein